MEHKYEATTSQIPIKVDGAQSSIDKKTILPKNIGNQASCLVKGP
jgi:hypothetical protein